MNPQLWLNNTDPDLDAIARYAEAALLAAADEPVIIEINSIPVQLGVQQPPSDYRIYKGTMASFFDGAVTKADALRAQIAVEQESALRMAA